MNHPTASRMCRQRPARLSGVLLASCLLLQGFALGGASGEGEDVSVLIFFDDTDYHWVSLDVRSGTSALCATLSACGRLGLKLNYSMSQYGAFVTGIGGLEAPLDFSWWWYLLIWNRSSARWEEAPAGAGELQVSGGDSLCWCPSSLAPPVPNPLTKYPWPCFRGDSRNRGVTSVPSPDRANVLWFTDLSNGPIDTTPAVADGRVFVSTGGIYNWSTMAYDAPPHLYALDAATGRVIWSVETTAAGWQVSSPAVRGGRVFIGTTDGKVMSFSSGTGERLWSFKTAPSATGITSSPVATGEALYAASGDGRLYALSLDGEELWSFELGGPAYMCTPALSEDRIFAGSDAGVVWCVGVNGSPVWNFTVEGKIRASPVVSGKRVYIVSTIYSGWEATGGRLYCLDAANGRSLWPSPLELNASTATPTVARGTIYLGTASGVLGVDESGRILWEVPSSGPVQASPSTDGRMVYFAENCRNGTLRAVNSSTGAPAWSMIPEPHQYLLSSPALSDGRLYFGSDNGRVYCLGPLEQRADRNSGKGTGPGIYLIVLFIVATVSLIFIISLMLWKQKGRGGC
ncbi:MAG: PQQ-binding-like beta-propeller repeat protein [Thermoplasmata archaeon]